MLKYYADADSWEEQTTTRDQFVPVTQSPQTARWNEEQQHLPTRLPGRPPSETISEAQLRIVGERVVFKCEAPGASSYDSKISWEKFTGEMPKNYRIDDTNFIIPRLRKEDVGIYRCLVETINGDTHMSTVELKVGDYVPTFTGQTVLEVTPLERDEWQRLQIELSVRPTSPDGTIYHAELNPGQTNQQLFHNIALKRGHVVYTYDIGAGAGRIQSNDPIQLGEWSRIFVKSNPAQVSLNVNGQESNYTNSRPVPAILNIGDGQAHIGGMSSESQHYHRFGEKINFKGSISRLVVNDQLIDIGESATSPPELTLSLSSNECFIEPCQNNGQCLPAHEHEGYRCECDAEFEGTHCQFKTRRCSDKAECVTGICVESEWNQPKCVCPWRRYGSLCELEGHPGGIEDELLESPSHRDSTFRFNGETSFMSIQAPESSRHFRLSLNLTPVKTNTSQLIAYVSSGYSSKRSDYMALTLENEQFTAIYKTRDGREEVRSLERAEAGKTYNVGFLRTGKQIEVVVNGRSAMTSVELPVFASGTALYLGGLPPGMRPNEEISEHDFFQGCAAQILVNRELVRMDDERFNAKTGDLQPCVGEPAPVNVSITEIQQPLAFSRPKTTYATRPKTHLHGPPQKVEETQPDDALLYTIISSTTVAPRPTFQMDEHDRVLPNVYPESSESTEFEPLDISEEELEVSTLAPTISTTTSTTTPKPIVKTTQRPRTTTPPSPSPTIIWQTEESTGSLNVQQSTPPPTVYSRPEIPESRKKPDLTYTDRLPESTEIDSSSTEIDPRLRDSDKNKQSISQDPKLNEATDDYSKTDLDRHPANLTPTRETQKEDHLSTTSAYVNELEVDPYLTRFGIERMCRPSTCGEHGVCEPLNLTHVTCSCKDYYTGPNCDVFKPIEHAARFEGNAFIVFSVDEFPHLTSEKHEVIEMELRTTAHYGVIFWQGQDLNANLAGEDYVSLGLTDGHLVFSYELGGGAAQITSLYPINDGKLHRIRAERQGRNGSLIVDNDWPLNGTSSGILAMLNVEGNLFMGGLPNLPQMTSGLHTQNFVGCIANFRLNERPLDLMANAIDGRNVKPCETWPMEIKKWLKDLRRTRRRFRKKMKRY